MSERLVWKLKKRLNVGKKERERFELCLPSWACKARQGSMPFLFQTTVSKDSFQVADGMVVLLPPSALSYGDAGKPSVHHTEIAAHRIYSYRAEQVMEKVKRFIQC